MKELLELIPDINKEEDLIYLPLHIIERALGIKLDDIDEDL